MFNFRLFISNLLSIIGEGANNSVEEAKIQKYITDGGFGRLTKYENGELHLQVPEMFNNEVPLVVGESYGRVENYVSNGKYVLKIRIKGSTSETDKFNFKGFIENILLIIGDCSFNSEKETKILSYIKQSGMEDYVSYGTNRMCVRIPKKFNGQVLGQGFENGEYVLKFPFNGTVGYSDNLTEADLSDKAEILNIFTKSYGFIFDGKVLVQEFGEVIKNLSHMGKVENKLKSFYDICDKNGIVISDGSKFKFFNHCVAGGNFKTLDYAYYRMIGAPITEINRNKQRFICPLCGTGYLSYKMAEHKDDIEGYVCSNHSCVAHSDEDGYSDFVVRPHDVLKVAQI